MSSQKNYTWKRVFVTLICLVSLGLFAFIVMHAYYVFQVVQSIHLNFSNSSSELALFERALVELIIPLAIWIVIQTIFFFWLLRHFFRSTSKAYFAGSRQSKARDVEDEEEDERDLVEAESSQDLDQDGFDEQEDEDEEEDEIQLSPVQKEEALQPAELLDVPAAPVEPVAEPKSPASSASAWEPVARTIEPEAKAAKPTISFKPQFKEAPQELKEALNKETNEEAVASPLPQVAEVANERPVEPAAAESDISKTQVLAAVQDVAQEISDQSASAVKDFSPSFSDEDEELVAPKPLSRRERRKRLKEK